MKKRLGSVGRYHMFVWLGWRWGYDKIDAWDWDRTLYLLSLGPLYIGWSKRKW
jgi:hypothetical protein